MKFLPRTVATLAVAVMLTASITTPSGASWPEHKHHDQDSQPVVIAHRGASGYRPEHTIAAYEHRPGLTVVGWTFRRENEFLPLEFRSSLNPADPGDLVGEIRVFLEAGMDQFFTDNPDLGVAAVTQADE